jgi:hypothetical protein
MEPGTGHPRIHYAQRENAVLIIYGLTVFASALLLFFVQPMFARMVLPLLGGTPGVWTTTQVFCEGGLLVGYLYAHASTRWLGVRKQIILHMAVMLAALMLLPIQVPLGWVPPADSNPIVWMLSLLAVSIGLPFFVVSSSSPLLQRWFAWTQHRHRSDPYFLYASSNMGSMAALVIYPALAERWLHLSNQSWLWTVGYCLLLVLTGSCAWFLWRSKADSAFRRDEADGEPTIQLTNGRRWRWILLAFVPSSLMLSVTTYLTTDIASVPLLWVIPLGIYLLTFILVFSRRQLVSHRFMLKAMPILILPLVIALACRGSDPISIAIPMHLVAFFLVAMVCHGELAMDRPRVEHLTEFYLCLSAGGFLGGIFNALIAPAIFKSVAEYPIVLALSCLLLPRGAGESPRPHARLLDFIFPILLTLATVFVVFKVEQLNLNSAPLEHAVMFGIPAIVCFSFSRRPLRFALAVGGILWAGNFYVGTQGRVLHAERSFFGVSRITMDSKGRFHQYRNGTTLHGSQRNDPPHRHDATTYYCRTGPLGQFFEYFGNSDQMRRIAIIGLGVGGITAYARSGQQWTYYEIDPSVRRIAQDTRYFTYLSDCPANLAIILGDGRMKLSEAPDGSYDVLILDAYSSDSVPVHLLDRQALQLYLRKVTVYGKLLFHISNRYLDLEPVIGNLSRDAGLFALSQSDSAISPLDAENDKTPSGYVVLGRTKGDLEPLAQDPRWMPVRTRPGLGVWTDDFSSILAILR